MEWTDARTAITTRFLAGFTVMPVRVEGEEFQIPKTGRWCALYLREGGSDLITLGGPTRLTRNLGLINIQLYAPRNEGLGGLATVGVQAGKVFELQEFSGVLCRAAVSKSMGEEGQWTRRDVDVPFQWDRIE